MRTTSVHSLTTMMNQSASEFKLTTKYIQMIHGLKIVFAKSLTSVANFQINKIVREVGKKSIRYQVLPMIRSQNTHNPKKVKSIQFSKLLAGYEQDILGKNCHHVSGRD